MRYTTLGRTQIQVSSLCLGTMTFDEQNTEARLRLDRATEADINFIDTAEMYPVPPKAETQGRTEQYIGSWLARHGRRDRLIIANQVTGAVGRSHRPVSAALAGSPDQLLREVVIQVSDGEESTPLIETLSVRTRRSGHEW